MNETYKNIIKPILLEWYHKHVIASEKENKHKAFYDTIKLIKTRNNLEFLVEW